jgi:RimJ/RimL family protein N-acetyltransferase
MARMIQGKRVILRRVEPADYPLILRWQNDPEVFRWMDYERPFSLQDIADSEVVAAKEGHPFVIEVDGLAIGRIGLNRFRPRDRLAALYLFMGERDAWGKGYGQDAVIALLAYAFDTCGLERVELWTLADNERAIRLYKACGFIEEAHLADRSWKEGRWVDHLWMSVTRDDFARVRGDQRS